VYQWAWEDGTIAVNPPPRPALVNGRGETTVAYHDLAWGGGQFVVFGCGDGQQLGQEMGRGDFILTADLSYVDNVHHVMLAECTQTPIITNANGSAGVSLAQDGETIQVIRADGSLIAEIPYPASLPQAFGLNGDATRLMIGMGQQALGGGAVDIQISEWRLDGTSPQEILILRDCWEACEKPSRLGLIRAIAYHPSDESIFAVGGGDIDRENYVQIWRVSDDPAGGELLFQSPKLPRPIRALAFTSDGRLIATGEDGLIRIWDIPN
jgi:WD40 repeat protein